MILDFRGEEINCAKSEVLALSIEDFEDVVEGFPFEEDCCIAEESESKPEVTNKAEESFLAVKDVCTRNNKIRFSV